MSAAPRTWTDAEDEVLTAEWLRGTFAGEIAERLSRTLSEVRGRAMALGLTGLRPFPRAATRPRRIDEDWMQGPLRRAVDVHDVDVGY